MSEETSADLVARWQQGDQQAADELFHRYAERLLALARGQISARLAARVDAEDVVQSAYRSFFAGARSDRYVLQHSGDLWHLLVAITVHKLRHQVRRHSAAKRTPQREQTFGTESSLSYLQADAVAREPQPEEALAVVDELGLLLGDLKPLHRRMVELRLQGYGIEEIAAATERSQRLVYRVLEQLKGRLRERCQAVAGW